MPQTVKEYQSDITTKLQKLFSTEEVKMEWSIFNESEDRKSKYCPRVDVVVGPLAMNGSFEFRYNDMATTYRFFIIPLLKYYQLNIEKYADPRLPYENPTENDMTRRNLNARCFMAIEIEHRVSRKHLIGSILNSSSLGRVGIIIAWSDEKLKAFIKLRNYLGFLKDRGKNTFEIPNVLIVSKDQFMEALNESIGLSH